MPILKNLEIPAALVVDVAEAKSLGHDEARFLVDTYYELQKSRVRANNRLKALAREDKPNAVMEKLRDLYVSQEKTIQKILNQWVKEQPIGQWSLQVLGVGPIIASGLIAHIDITQRDANGNVLGYRQVSNIWAFAGYDPTKTWEKGKKRPWNAALKLLAYNLGISFRYQCNNPKSLYGKIYTKRKSQETWYNEDLRFEDQAKSILSKKNIGKDTEAYKYYIKGKLPPAHIDARARRYVVKIFLSHWWECAWRLANPGKQPPEPWAIAHGGHAHYTEPEVPYPVI
jgi:transcriptional regulator with XRE-family HTH domain